MADFAAHSELKAHNAALLYAACCNFSPSS
jgi:hypothetical protein